MDCALGWRASDAVGPAHPHTAGDGTDSCATRQAPEAGSIFRVDGTGATGVPSTEYAH